MFDPTQLQDVRQTDSYANYLQFLGWQTIQEQSIITYKKKILPFLPFAIQKTLRAPKLIQEKERNPYLLVNKQEPLIVEKIDGNQIYFQIERDNSWPLTPTKTIWLDLEQSQEEIVANFKQKIRYNWKRTQLRNLEVKKVMGNTMTPFQLQAFYDLWSVNKPHDWFFKPKIGDLKAIIDAFGDKCFLIFIFNNHSSNANDWQRYQELNIKPLACNLTILSDNMAFYWYNAANLLGKQLFAPTRAVYESILFAKEQGSKVYDFEGIWDERFPKLNLGWKGFTKFKQGFCKNVSTPHLS